MDRGVVSVIWFLVIFLQLRSWASANVVFQVHHKFTGNNRSLTAYKDHDSDRHRRILSAADLPIGGNGSPTSTALYFTKIRIGTPPKDYYVQVDTGSDLLWVNCVGCENCPRRSDLGIPLSLYDPMRSSSSKTITCDQDFCASTVDSSNSDCVMGTQCSYSVRYGDGSSTKGYFVRDEVQVDRVSGNLQTDSMRGSITFGCGSRQSGGLGSTQQALDGIFGFGQANSSMISQLALANKVKKVFSHCLAGSIGGGIFAIGEVVHPTVKTTPIMPHEPHYNIELKAIKVGDEVVPFTMDMYNSVSKRGTIIDTGTTLAYFPHAVYNQLMEKIMATQPYTEVHTFDEFKCYQYTGNVDDGFPIVTFYFANSLSMKVYPRQYLFRYKNKEWCIGFSSNGVPPKNGQDLTLLGDLVLTDKLVTYNMEDQTIGWTEYDCSSSIVVNDEETGMMFEVGAHNVMSSGCTRCSILVWVFFVIATKLVMYQD